ncbi:DUF4017 family protein [Virgibacillus dakarensis]|uniref:DUF4017 family protein n=1 Tax=Virgibacillus dakarensis TaxID=1917889 RepID=UPI000B43951F|nr:DUF4017 family protein [Virgibacillus dakarensis]
MKGFIIALLVYIVICVIAVLIPVSEGYNDIGWKLFVGQVYAIPAFIITVLIVFFIKKTGQ